MPPGRPLQPRPQPVKALLTDLAKEGKGDVPELTARPPQVTATGPGWRERRVQVIEDGGGRYEADEKPHHVSLEPWSARLRRTDETLR